MLNKNWKMLDKCCKKYLINVTCILGLEEKKWINIIQK